MKFYRVEVTELLETGISVYVFFVPPEGLTDFMKMFEKYKDAYDLAEPELVEIDTDLETGDLIAPNEKHKHWFMRS